MVKTFVRVINSNTAGDFQREINERLREIQEDERKEILNISHSIVLDKLDKPFYSALIVYTQ